MQDGEYARFKRAAETFAIDPDFRRLAAEHPAAALSAAGLALEDPPAAMEAAAMVSCGCAVEAGENPYAKEYVRRNGVTGAYVAETHAREAYADRELYLFADAARNRCRMENRLLRFHSNIRYYPLCFELSRGCSVQCPFCGLDAKPWTADFRYTPENARLWRAVLQASRELLGPVAGASPCYFATEPLGNPDYERFLEDFAEVMGSVPQTTTAVADREAERLRRLMRRLGPERLERQAALRFTVRTLAQFHRISELFSPEELIGVELLPNNPESLNRYSASGRTRSGRTGKSDPLSYSICCVAGLRVNMVEKSISFIEPEIPDERWPLGLRVREERSFSDAESYRRAIAELTGKWSVGTLPPRRALAWNRHCRIERTADAVCFLGDGVGYRIPKNLFTEAMLPLVERGCAFEEILRETGLPAAWRESFTAMMNQLYLRGYLRLR